MNRLDFLKRSALAAVTTVAGSAGLSALLTTQGCSSTPKEKIIGLQLYSLRDAMGQDVPVTLAKVAGYGYKTLETAGYNDGKLYGYSPKDFRKMAEDLGMKVTGAHLGQGYTPEKDAEIMEWWKKALDAQSEVGCKYSVQPWVPIGSTLDSMKIQCDYFSKVTELAKARDLKFGFHNHAGEFAELEGQVIFDYMIANTPDDMIYELDVYWAVKGGKNPVDYINKYASRIPLLHIKDESIIGEGDIDFEAIFNAAYSNNIKDYYVEVERYTLPAENCVERSFDYLNTAPFVK